MENWNKTHLYFRRLKHSPSTPYFYHLSCTHLQCFSTIYHTISEWRLSPAILELLTIFCPSKDFLSVLQYHILCCPIARLFESDCNLSVLHSQASLIPWGTHSFPEGLFVLHLRKIWRTLGVYGSPWISTSSGKFRFWNPVRNNNEFNELQVSNTHR